MSYLGVRCVRAWRVLPMLLAVSVAGSLLSHMAVAQTCGAEYKIKEGETLAQIAARVYGNPTQWTVIFYANQDRLGTNASLLVPGLAIALPCIGGTAQPSQSQSPLQNATTPSLPPTSADSPIMISAMVRRIEFLTPGGYAPFTGSALEGGGMLTEVVSSPMGIIKQEARGR